MVSTSAVGFVGLDELSIDIAATLIRLGYRAQAFEPSESLMNKFLELDGTRCTNSSEAVKDATVVFISPSADQGKKKMYDEAFIKDLHKDGVIVMLFTSRPSYVEALEESVTGTTGVVDAYAFENVSKTLNGQLVVSVSGKEEAIAKARPLLVEIFDEVYILDGKAGAASKARMIVELLQGIHIVASVEAMFLGTAAGVHPEIIYEIISSAAGSSWAFENFVPQMLSEEYKETMSVDALVQNLGIVLDVATSLTFPLPLLTMAHQQLISGSSCAYKNSGNSGLCKVWETNTGICLKEAARANSYSPRDLAVMLLRTAKSINKVGFIGLGAMGFGMATTLLGLNFTVAGFDVYTSSVKQFADAGGLVGNSPADVSKDVDVLVLMVTNEAQVDAVLFGDTGSLAALPPGATIIISSTVSPGFIKNLEQRLQDQQMDLKLVDAPVSGGVKRAADGRLTIMASGTEDALNCAGLVLSALSEHLYIIRGGCGAGSCVKMINQLLAGVHIAASAEAMAFGSRLGLNMTALFDTVTKSRGTSWMFENRVPHILDDDYTPYSALDIFVKDLGIVTREGLLHKIPLYISSVAYQQFLAGSASGWGRFDDAAVVKVYEKLSGVHVVSGLPGVKRENVLSSLPSEWPGDLIENIHNLVDKHSSSILVVLDDDPTGTQTVHDIDVLMEWSIDILVEEFIKRPRCFFILTNSRSLSSEKAMVLTKDICSKIDIAAKSLQNISYTIVLRGDSTLRGHFPEEPDAIISVLGEMDVLVLCPFFLQGGRFTVDDIHYVADSDRLIPAGKTEFAKDASFGYKVSNLREWVAEKTKGRVAAGDVASISIHLLRTGGPTAVCEFLCRLPKGSICVVNAASESDIMVFASGMLEAEMKGKRFLCRTAASFISARIGIMSHPLISPKDVGMHRGKNGGLIVVGSYVPKTTKQVQVLKAQLGANLKYIEVSVDKVAMKSSEEREEEIHTVVELADVSLAARKNTLIVTSRKLITGNCPAQSLAINSSVSSALVEVVRRIKSRPCYILSKGGITSSDLATKALGAKRARVLGQVWDGVPLWELGPESQHPGVPFIVFPGNVGDDSGLAEVVKKWSCSLRPSTRNLLLNARNEGYAVGAFNVYNVEGVEAVVAAAEEERSPAILQIHPGALKGARSLVACCFSAAEHSTVPITVHFDHGSSRWELLDAVEMGFDSIMIDGSHLSFAENTALTKYVCSLAHAKNIVVEAELGRLSGTEDDLTVEDYEAKLTDIAQAGEFIEATGIDALAVCIGNVHGKYPASGPRLRLDLLKELNKITLEKDVLLVLHGASGLPKELIMECIQLGVRKFNVNTEVRNAYLHALQGQQKDLVHLLTSAKEAMKAIISEKMRLFGSAGKA